MTFKQLPSDQLESIRFSNNGAHREAAFAILADRHRELTMGTGTSGRYGPPIIKTKDIPKKPLKKATENSEVSANKITKWLEWAKSYLTKRNMTMAYIGASLSALITPLLLLALSTGDDRTRAHNALAQSIKDTFGEFYGSILLGGDNPPSTSIGRFTFHELDSMRNQMTYNSGVEEFLHDMRGDPMTDDCALRGSIGRKRDAWIWMAKRDFEHYGLDKHRSLESQLGDIVHHNVTGAGYKKTNKMTNEGSQPTSKKNEWFNWISKYLTLHNVGPAVIFAVLALIDAYLGAKSIKNTRELNYLPRKFNEALRRTFGNFYGSMPGASSFEPLGNFNYHELVDLRNNSEKGTDNHVMVKAALSDFESFGLDKTKTLASQLGDIATKSFKSNAIIGKGGVPNKNLDRVKQINKIATKLVKKPGNISKTKYKALLAGLGIGGLIMLLGGIATVVNHIKSKHRPFIDTSAQPGEQFYQDPQNFEEPIGPVTPSGTTVGNITVL